MTAQPNFCAHCGATLRAGARFCPSCGQAVEAIPSPPPAVPAYQTPPPAASAYQPPAQVVYTSPPLARLARPRIRLGLGSILLLVVGVLLVLLLLARFVALEVVGETTVGTVMAVELVDREDYAYQVSYSFRGPDGAIVNGSTTFDEVLNIGTLPTVGDDVTVRYLPFCPAVNKMLK
jgi:uncharacterized membrane protein YphA (DoxX/SURF4 family)